MKHWKRFAYFSIAVLLGVLLGAAATSQEQKPSHQASKPQAIQPPEHPITEEQLRTFFKVTHFLSFNRPLIHEKLEAQHKQMPEWYPQSVWNEIADAIDNIDFPEVALPVYQKYVSENDARFFIRFMVTPQGQELTHSLLTKNIQAQYAGAAPEQAYEQALTELARNEGAEVERILSGMSPAELHEVESQSARWQQMQPAMKQMRGEVSQVIAARQMELARSIAVKHQAELARAKHNYEATPPNLQSPVISMTVLLYP